MRIVVLASGSGTLLQSLLDAQAGGELAGQIVAVGSDVVDAQALERAEAAGVPTFSLPLNKGSDRRVWDEQLTKLVAEYEPDLVISAGFMKILGSAFLAKFAGRCINSHPALLPSFPGIHGVRDALKAGVKITGTTVFMVDEGVDTGQIIAQEAVKVKPDDDEASLHERIKVEERKLLKAVVNEFGGRMNDQIAVRRALVSVYDKTGLVELGQGLAEAGVEIVSTGSTAARLKEAGVPVTAVEELTGFPECLGGRVKTLHPKVHAGILADRRLKSHRDELAKLSIDPFDLVVVNLYPFAATVASGASQDECVEQIDIGGPSMVRAAAKNFPSVAVLTDPARYSDALLAVKSGGFTLSQRQKLAAQAFAHTAAYDAAVASWMAEQFDSADGFPQYQGGAWHKLHTLRYGENSHQQAAIYAGDSEFGGLTKAEQLHGKQMSYNNYTDADAAYRAAYDFAEPCVAIIKHANPCGIAIGGDIAEAHRLAHACDSTSAFGGVIATNREVSLEMANQVADIFTEVIVAPGYEAGALEVLSRKKNVRILKAEPYRHPRVLTREISGGLLVQTPDKLDAAGDDPANWTLVSGEPAGEAMLKDLLFAWKACRAVKSNAILLAKSGASVGVGMGQVNRVDSCRLAAQRAGDRASGSVAASDAFFPFSDGPQILIDAGVKAIVQPGGSIRDDETIAASKEAGVTMYLTGNRHFFH